MSRFRALFLGAAGGIDTHWRRRIGCARAVLHFRKNGHAGSSRVLFEKDVVTTLLEGQFEGVCRHVDCVLATLPGRMQRDDLLLEGIVGVLDAAADFDVDQHGDFDRYVSVRVQNAVIGALQEESDVAAGRRRRPLPHRRKSQNTLVVERYMGLVRSVAQRIAAKLPPRVVLDDLIADGVIGLLDAVAKYDPEKNDNFKKYARIRIQGAIIDGIRVFDWVPRAMRRRHAKYVKIATELEKKLGHWPTFEELGRELAIDPVAAQDLWERLRPIVVVGFDDLRPDPDGSGAEGSQLFPDTGSPTPHHNVLHTQVLGFILASIDELGEKPRQVIYKYYFEDMKFHEIGDELGVTESRISQIHSESLKKLRIKLTKRLRDPVDGRFEDPLPT